MHFTIIKIFIIMRWILWLLFYWVINKEPIVIVDLFIEFFFLWFLWFLACVFEPFFLKLFLLWVRWFASVFGSLLNRWLRGLLIVLLSYRSLLSVQGPLVSGMMSLRSTSFLYLLPERDGEWHSQIVRTNILLWVYIRMYMSVRVLTPCMRINNLFASFTHYRLHLC